jgi:hypothetical protein
MVREALTRAGVIAAADALTGGLTGQLARTAARAGRPGTIAGHVAAGGAVEPLGEAAGEAGAQLATTGEIRPGEVLVEALGGAGIGVPTTAGQVAMEMARRPAPRPQPSEAPTALADLVQQFAPPPARPVPVDALPPSEPRAEINMPAAPVAPPPEVAHRAGQALPTFGPAKPAPPAASSAAVQPDGASPNVVMLDPGTIEADAERFQFKTGGDAEGVTDQLRGVQQWSDEGSGIAIGLGGQRRPPLHRRWASAARTGEEATGRGRRPAPPGDPAPRGRWCDRRGGHVPRRHEEAAGGRREHERARRSARLPQGRLARGRPGADSATAPSLPRRPGTRPPQRGGLRHGGQRGGAAEPRGRGRAGDRGRCRPGRRAAIPRAAFPRERG